jgi:iron complex outermembrane recepter protein
MNFRCAKTAQLHAFTLCLCTSLLTPTLAEEILPPVIVKGQPSFEEVTEQILAPLKQTTSTTALRPNGLNELPYSNAVRLEDLADQVPSMQARTTDAGLTSAVNIRGFVTSKHYINGLPDIQRMFVRDLYTVDDIQIIRGSSGIISGNSSPGGTVWYSSSMANGQTRQMATITLGNDAWQRIGLDLSAPLSETVSARLVGVWKDGISNPGDLTQEAYSILASGRWQYAKEGSFTVELERTNNKQPFSFGTVITNGQPRYNQLYASPNESSSRIADRQAIHWMHNFKIGNSSSLAVRADYQKADVHRDESLIGFYTITSATKLSGYFTKYVDNYNQSGSKLEAEFKTKLSDLLLSSRVGVEYASQDNIFTGSQNIGGFSVDIQNPTFDAVNTSSLALRARYAQTEINERGIYALQTIENPNAFNFSLGMRRTAFDSMSISSAGVTTQTAKDQGDVFRASLAIFPRAVITPYVSYSEGFQPNTGLTRFGTFLAPQRSNQWELGAQWKSGITKGSVAAYKIRLENLPLTDPLDRASFVASGERQVQGIEAVSQTSLSESWKITGLLNVMSTKNVVKTSATQGDEFAGIPKTSGTLRIENRFFWLQAQGVGQRWLNATNTLKLKGYDLWNTGLIWRQKQWDVSASVSNLLNKNYVLSSTDVDDVYQGPKRRIWITFKGRV